MTDPAEPIAGRATSPTVDPGRVKIIRRILGVGVLLLGGGLAAGFAFSGGSGATSLAGFLLGSTLSCIFAAIYGICVSLLDDLRDDHVSRARLLWIAGSFAGAILLPAMMVGIGG